MLDKRDALIGRLARSLGLVNDAGLQRGLELRKRFPDRAFEQLLQDAGLIDKEGRSQLAQAFNQKVREMRSGPGAGSGSQRAPAPPPPRPSSSSSREERSISDSGMIVPDEEDGRFLATPRRPAASPGATSGRSAPPPAPRAPEVDPLATPGSEDLLSDSDAATVNEEQLLAEPTIVLRDEPAPAAKKRPKPAPANEDEILSEPTLMMRDEELRAPPAAPRRPSREAAPPPRRPEPALRAEPDEEQILAEPTLMLPADEPPSEDAILAEPTIMLADDELKRPASGSARAKAPPPPEDAPLDLVPDLAAPADEPELGVPDEEPAAGGGAGIPDELRLASSQAPSPSGPQPGVKKKGGVLDRREFERRSKLRLGFEGTHLGDYEIVGELSRGAFGVVLKVRPEGTGRALARERGFLGEFMAMKVMLETNDPEETRRFMDEVRVLIALVHPNIVRIFDAGVEGGLKFYTMELIEGVDSRALVREQGGKLPVLYAVRITKDVASALAVVHQKTIYHRDLKPANVMIDRGSQPYRTVLIDFGLVQKKQGAKADEGLVLGTPSYMPPEQAKPKGGFGEVNSTSDVYSLGATFYFLLTGTSPFPGKDPREIIKRVCSEPPPNPMTLNPEIPKTIAAICMKCLAKGQRDRYVAARLLEQELDKELNSAQLKLKAKSYVRKIFGGGGGEKPGQQPGAPKA